MAGICLDSMAVICPQSFRPWTKYSIELRGLSTSLRRLHQLAASSGQSKRAIFRP
jgi:hypothetical protein